MNWTIDWIITAITALGGVFHAIFHYSQRETPVKPLQTPPPHEFDPHPLPDPLPAPAPVLDPPTEPRPNDKVRLAALAQQQFEGFFPGSSAYRHLNPGNLKALDGSFITYPDYETGFLALEDYIRRVATGKHHAYPKGGETTIAQYVRIYTSDGEPAWTNYANAIARATALSPASKMVELLT